MSLLPPLTIELEFARAEQAGDPYGFRFMPQEYLLRSAGGGFESSSLMWNEALLADMEAARKPGRDPVVLQRLGEKLRRFLAPLGWAEQETRILEASRQGRRLLVTIRSAAAELYALPWELLILKATGQHVGELAGVLIRYEWPETTTVPEARIPSQGGSRILLAWSAAGGAVPAAEHQRAIQNACKAGFQPFDSAHDVIGHVSFGRLGRTLETARKQGRPIAVLHLLCHGGAVGSTFGLVLDGDDASDGATVVDAGRLRLLLAPYADMVRLVVLAACDSGNSGALGNQLGSVAQTLHRAGLSTVVASRYPLSVSGSIRLASALYEGLLVGPVSLEDALLGVRDTLARDAAQLDWASLQLYARAADGLDTRPVTFLPYQGLSAFDPEHRRFFFGREALIDKLWRRCKDLFASPDAMRLFAVLGPSGSGKSSVARAGLLAELKDRGLSLDHPIHTALFKPGAHPMQALNNALHELPDDDSDAQVLIMVDQLEEIYTLCKDSGERDAFVEFLLTSARDPSRRLTIVVTMRSDFLGETQRHHRTLNQLIAAQHEIVPALTDEELRSVISEPARKAGRPIDEETVELLLTQAQSSESALPLVQFALSRIWQGMLAGKPPGATLHDIGGIGGALAGKAQALFAELSESEQDIARRALTRLVQLGEGTRDTRRRVPIRELCGRVQTEAEVLSVLRRFSSESARLVSLSVLAGETLAEVTHEALFDYWADLRKWIDEGRADRRFHDRVAEAARLWDETGRASGRLWRPPDLDLLRMYRNRRGDDLSPLQHEFTNASCEQMDLELREKERAHRELQEAYERIRRQLLATYTERGRQLLVEQGQPNDALLWLNRAYVEGSREPMLAYLLRASLWGVDSTHTILVGHEDVVLSATYSPDGQRVVTTSEDNTARVWEAETGQLVTVLKCPAAIIRKATYSPCGQHIVTAGEDRTARVWEAETGRLLTQLSGHEGSIHDMCFGLDGKFIVTGSEDKTARIWNAETGRLIQELKGHEAMLWSVAFSPDCRWVASGSEDGTARIWETQTGQPIVELKGHGDRIYQVSFSPDGKRLATASEDKTARIWDAESGCTLAQLKGHGDRIYQVSFSPDGKRLATVSEDKTARIWDAESGRTLAQLKGHTNSLSSLAYSPNGQRIVTASLDKTVRVWDAETGRHLATFRGHGSRVRTVQYSPDGRRILTASRDQTARIWNDQKTQLLAELKGHGDVVWSATYSPDGGRIVTASEDKVARVFDAKTGDRLFELTGHEDSVLNVKYSPCCRHIVTASWDRTARVWSAGTGRLISELKGHEGIVRSAIFSPNGQGIVTASSDQTARVWDAETGRLLMILSGHQDGVRSATYSPDGTCIVTASEDKTARIWDAKTGQQCAELKGHKSAVLGALYSPDGRHLVTASEDRTARVWDAESGHALLELKGHGDIIRSAAYSPEGHRILTASEDKTARVWDATTGRLLAELAGHGAAVTSAMYEAESLRILTASEDKTARIWDAETGRLLAELKGHEATLYAALFSPDGQHIVTASADKTARIWDFSREARTPVEIAELISRYVPVLLEGDVIVPTVPQPASSAVPASKAETVTNSK